MSSAGSIHCTQRKLGRALFGENLQDGVAGFGKSPAGAFADFDKSWSSQLAPVAADGGEK